MNPWNSQQAAPSLPCPSTEVTQRRPLKMLPQRFKMVCSLSLTAPVSEPTGRSRLGFLPINAAGQRLSSEWNRNSRPLRVKGIRWLVGQFYPPPSLSWCAGGIGDIICSVDWGRWTTLDVSKKKDGGEKKSFHCWHPSMFVRACSYIRRPKFMFALKKKWNK